MEASMVLTMILAIALFAVQGGQTPPRQGPPRGGGRGMGNMIAPVEETGFRPIFDGQSLKGWDCDPDFWRVENGILVGETKADHQPKQNIFCVWRGGKPADFELKLQYRMSGADSGNSGIQYRSVEMPE